MSAAAVPLCICFSSPKLFDGFKTGGACNRISSAPMPHRTGKSTGEGNSAEGKAVSI